ncbi:MAG TPA: ATP-binding protein [Gemmatimonadaceae bacterium]
MNQSHLTEAIDRDRLYRLLVEQVHEYAIFALDADGTVITWNPGAERFKGYKPDEIIGRNFSVFYSPNDIAAGVPGQLLEEAKRSGQAKAEGWRVRKDGSRFWAHVTITALHDDDGRLIGFAKITRDLTDRRADEMRARRLAAEQAAHAVTLAQSKDFEQLNRQLQDQAAELESQTEEAQSLAEELEQANQSLQTTLLEAEEAREAALSARQLAEEANRAKTDFLATMSHELRTPLNAIQGYTSLLQLGVKGSLNDEQTNYLTRVERSARYLLSLIQDVLSFAKLETGRVEFRIAPISVRALLTELESLVMPQVQDAHHQLSLAICPDDVHVLGDDERLRQILLNLLSNAIKFTPTGGSIELGCTTTASEVAITVRDSGDGIPPDKLEAIFAPFVQLRRSSTGSQAGTGLGLSISRDLARAMNGELIVESKIGDGSRFSVVLPRADGTSNS